MNLIILSIVTEGEVTEITYTLQLKRPHIPPISDIGGFLIELLTSSELLQAECSTHNSQTQYSILEY